MWFIVDRNVVLRPIPVLYITKGLIMCTLITVRFLHAHTICNVACISQVQEFVSTFEMQGSHSSECQYYDLLIMGVIKFAKCYVKIVISCIVTVLITGFTLILFP